MPVVVAVPVGGIVRGITMVVPITFGMLVRGIICMVVAIAFGVGGHFAVVAHGGAILVGIGGVLSGRAAGEEECGGEEGNKRAFHVA